MLKSICVFVGMALVLALGACAEGGAAGEGERAEGLIIGPASYQDLACFPDYQRAYARGVARFEPAPPNDYYHDECTGILMPNGDFLTASACITEQPDAKGAPVGHVIFGERALTCGGIIDDVSAGRTFPAYYANVDYGQGPARLRLGREVGGTQLPLELYEPARLSTREDAAAVAFPSYQGESPARLRLEVGCRVNDWHVNAGTYDFLWHDCDSAPGFIYWAEAAAGSPIVDMDTGYVVGVHLGTWPLEAPVPTNMGISIKTLVDTGFLAGVPLDGAAPADGARDPFCATFPDHPWC